MTAEAGIRVVRRVQPRPPEEPPPTGGGWLVRSAVDGRRVFVHVRVIDAIRNTNARYTPDEVAGLLTGGVFTHRGQAYAIVNNLVAHRPGEIESSPGRVRITTRGAESMSMRAKQQDPLCHVLGWWHTHPRFAAYYSVVDREEQRHWRPPLSVGLVLSGAPGTGPEWLAYLGPDSDETFSSTKDANLRNGHGQPSRIRTAGRTRPAMAAAVAARPPDLDREAAPSEALSRRLDSARTRPRIRMPRKPAVVAATAVVGLLLVLAAIAFQASIDSLRSEVTQLRHEVTGVRREAASTLPVAPRINGGGGHFPDTVRGSMTVPQLPTPARSGRERSAGAISSERHGITP